MSPGSPSPMIDEPLPLLPPFAPRLVLLEDVHAVGQVDAAGTLLVDIHAGQPTRGREAWGHKGWWWCLVMP